MAQEESKEKEAHLKNNDDDAATVSSSSADDDDDSDYDHGMPLFKYARLVGSLPRLPKLDTNEPSNAFSSPCTCSTIGKVILSPDVLDGDKNTPLSKRQSDLVWKYPHHVLAMGFKSGQVSVVDARTGVAIVSSKELKESRVSAMVNVAFDSSGTYLAALYANGMCTIWELKYAAVNPKTTTPVPATAASPPPLATHAQAQQDNNVFTSFLTGFNKSSPSNAFDSSSHHHDYNPTRSTIPSLKTISVQATRVPFPSSFGRPSCMAIDPAFKRNRDKLIIVGFRDGRLVMTKRGFLKRRTDLPIYQGSDGAIEAIVWRGHLVAWADESGIKLFDTETSRRIAHVDRPTGARAALYQTISSLRPTLVFETSENLLCAWGDCLMTLSVKERLVRRDNFDSHVSEDIAQGAIGNATPETQVVKRRTVQCTMAWELDCIACGVVPLDKDHIAVLGLVPTIEDESSQQESVTNDLEMHVMSREEGTVIYADTLPLIQFPNNGGKDSASGYTLLSTYALARMEDSIEAREEKLLNVDDDADEDIDFQMTLFSSARTEPFKDSHTKWSLRQLQFEEDVKVDKSHVEEPDDDSHGKHDDEAKEIECDDGEKDDDKSVDSDDYSFVLRPATEVPDENVPSPSAFPPMMVVVSPSDAVLVGSREVDDAVSYALSAKKYGLALKRALAYKRQLREYDVNELIDEYLRAVLRMSDSDTSNETQRDGDESSLSIRRLKLAAKAMPMLLGGNIRMWERWIAEFSKIPGGLFVLREHLPVRDPVLPSAVYEAILQTMLSEIEHVLSKKEDVLAPEEEDQLFPQMMGHFLSTLVAWGPSRSIRENIKLHRYVEDMRKQKYGAVDTLNEAVLRNAQHSLERRLHQTSSGYLQLPSPQQSEPAVSPSVISPPTNDTDDSLFSVDAILSKVSARVPLLGDDGASPEDSGIANNHAALEAMAELYMMEGEYKMALRCFLMIGCLHVSPDVLLVEDSAVRSVNGGKPAKAFGRYGFVLAMVEYQHLHQCLLDDNFLDSLGGNEQNKSPIPLVAFIQLVGLEDAGDFLVEHCVPPPVTRPTLPLSSQSRSSSNIGREEKNGNESLPINLVALQLRRYPRLFHWYLHQILTKKPEVYVKFPRTAVPPRSVTELHRSHLELYIEYTDKRDSVRALAGTETYNLDRMTTPLLSFLKAALPLGGIRPDEARRLLEVERTGNKQGLQSGDIVQNPNHFAIELAYVIEHFGKETEEDAKQILDLYLNGAKSLMLAVSYAQRNTEYSSELWTILIDYCLNSDGDKKDGSLFGSLLECAALSGADLAHLVTQIPQGMNVEGLRPRLVAAVADYRWKLKMHEAASNIGTNERVVLLRELAHRSRRGTRFSGEQLAELESSALSSPGATEAETKTDNADGETNVAFRPMQRPNHYRLSFAVPIR